MFNRWAFKGADKKNYFHTAFLCPEIIIHHLCDITHSIEPSIPRKSTRPAKKFLLLSKVFFLPVIISREKDLGIDGIFSSNELGLEASERQTQVYVASVGIVSGR